MAQNFSKKRPADSCFPSHFGAVTALDIVICLCFLTAGLPGPALGVQTVTLLASWPTCQYRKEILLAMAGSAAQPAKPGDVLDAGLHDML